MLARSSTVEDAWIGRIRYSGSSDLLGHTLMHQAPCLYGTARFPENCVLIFEDSFVAWKVGTIADKLIPLLAERRD